MSSGTATLLNANMTTPPAGTPSLLTLFMGVRRRFSINDTGACLRAGPRRGPYKPLAQAAVPIVTAYGADQRTHAGDGKVHFKVTGSAPNRVATIEWLNNQADFNTGGTAGLTYQVRLFETTGCVEYAYGSMTMSAAGAADANSQNPNIGFSTATRRAPWLGHGGPERHPGPPTRRLATPWPSVHRGAIPVLTSAADGSRRTFSSARPPRRRGWAAHLHGRHADRHDASTDDSPTSGLRDLLVDGRRRHLHLRRRGGPERDVLRGLGLAPSTTYD